MVPFSTATPSVTRTVLTVPADFDLSSFSIFIASMETSAWPAKTAGNSRMRKIGIVALARKLLIAFWRYLETGIIPEGAMLRA